MPNACTHIALFTNNPRRLINFYTKKLKFKEEKRPLARAALIKPIFGFDRDCRLVKLSCGSVRLEIIYMPSGVFKPRAGDRIGYSHWAYGVENKISFCRKLKRRGVDIIKVDKDGAPVYFIKDPDRNLIEVQTIGQ